jgi:hypothetical protein
MGAIARPERARKTAKQTSPQSIASIVCSKYSVAMIMLIVGNKESEVTVEREERQVRIPQ